MLLGLKLVAAAISFAVKPFAAFFIISAIAGFTLPELARLEDATAGLGAAGLIGAAWGTDRTPSILALRSSAASSRPALRPASNACSNSGRNAS
jgi:hypothetical protein